MKISRLLLFFIASIFVLTSCSRIDSGHAGIKVNKFGSDKGVDDVTEVTGTVFFNPFTQEIYEVPTFVQNVVYTADDSEGSDDNEEFRATTKDGLVVRFDVSMNYMTPDTSVVYIFKKYRKPVDELEKTVLRNYLRKAFNHTANLYTASELYENRNTFESKSTERIKEMLEPEGFVIEQVVLINDIRLPSSVVSNIEQKVNATQAALRKEEEIQQAKADSAKSVIKANGEAKVKLVKANAEAEANTVINRSLTPNLVRYYQVQRWNGITPKFVGGGGTGLILDLKDE